MPEEKKDKQGVGSRFIEEQKEEIKISKEELKRYLDNFEAHLSKRNRILENLAQSIQSIQARSLLDEEIKKTNALRSQAADGYSEKLAQLNKELEEVSRERDVNNREELNSSHR